MPSLLKLRTSSASSAHPVCSWLSRSLAALALAALLVPDVAAADEPVGVVVALPGVSLPRLLGKADELGGARWTGHRVTPRVRDDDRLRAIIGQARAAYLEADFLRCLSICRKALTDAPLEAWQQVGRLVFLSAACAHGAEDRDQATTHLQRLFVQDLAEESPCVRTRPDFLELMEAVRQQLVTRPRLRVEISSTPGPARVLVDGRLACDQTPCVLRLLPGEHHFTLWRLGVGQRALRRVIDRDTRLAVALDRLDPAEARQQLASAIGEAATTGFARAAATALSAQIVAVVWREQAEAHAMVYDHRTDRTVSRVKVAGQANADVSALQTALVEWRGSTRAFYTRPGFYIPVAAALAIAAGVVIYLAAQPGEPRTEFVFP